MSGYDAGLTGARVPAMVGAPEGDGVREREVERGIEEAGKRRERKQSRKRGNEGGKLCSGAFVG